MKKGIHPKYYPDAVIKCACGNEVRKGSTKKERHVEICSKCHPFYTGERKARYGMDQSGRVERFIKKYNWKTEGE